MQNINVSPPLMSMPNIEATHRYIAYGSVSASTVRGLRTKGVVDAARKALRGVKIEAYGSATPNTFPSILDADTESVRLDLPDGAQYWGVARKVLNIFLRGALYNTYLSSHFNLSKLDTYYEIPLDSLSAKGIQENTTERPYPKWTGVKYVTPEINSYFQHLATEIATQKGTLRVHLDAIFWGGRE